VDLLQSRSRNLSRDGLPAEDEQFSAEQNARLVRNAEEYYRRLYHGTTSSWNLRDRHMFDTLQAVSEHLHRIWPRPKIVVWEHNSHLGDARATSMADRGELNVGQLVRQVHRQDAVLIGFTTFDGTVAAATEWDGPLEIKRIRPAHPESYEAFFHEAELPEFMLLMREPGDAVDSLVLPRLERAIGVIYRPETELVSHYFRASLPAQFDAVIHYDRTTAIEPLDAEPVERGEFAETFPTGL
jgi:erythromycin esterase-like protein